MRQEHDAVGDARPVPAEILDEMVAYYRARAPEYDAWFSSQHPDGHRSVEHAPWYAEVGPVVATLEALNMAGDVLELAAGTGIWTTRLLHMATSVTAVDIAPEMLALHRERVADDRVQYILADLFTWSPDRAYDGVCAAFWLSHVPRERLDDVLRMVAAALKPGGKLFFVDSHSQHQPAADESQVVRRQLQDGRAFRIVKNHYTPAELVSRCAAAGLAVTAQETASVFLYAWGVRR
jgi:2-polyprenyl-3-methyl-5-hydroxy-6-metoxy-1,4-benzoquinol methylase